MPMTPGERLSFLALFESMRLRHFAAEEFLVSCGRPLNDEPPPELWGQIIPVALFLDELRSRLGKPVVLTSCYRAPAYNASVGGVRLSQHQAFRAADFACAAYAAPEVARIARGMRGVALEYTFMVQDGFGPLVESAAPTVEVAPGVVIPGERLERRPAQSGGRSYLVFRGGVGSYATFTHVDARGYNAGWAGAGGG